MTIGSTVLTPDASGAYTNVSSTFGGGAVGLVPFRLHGQDCSPPDGGNAVINAYTVVLRFYGPVTSTDLLPVNIWYREFIGGVWTSWTSDNNQWDVNSGFGTRRLELIYVDTSDPSIIPAGREYMIVPILTGTGALKCDKLLSGSAVPVADFEYHFFTP